MKSVWPQSSETQKQLIRYLLVGAVTAITELLVFALLVRVIKLMLAPSNIIATVIATILNFTLNKEWSFRNRSSITRSLILYLLLFTCNIVLSTNVIDFMVKFGVLDIYAKFMTMALITLWNFVLYRKVVFK